MGSLATSIVKGTLSKVGSLTPKTVFPRVQSALNYLYAGRWMKDHDFVPKKLVRDREQLIATIAAPICREEVLYLEFGVWRGDSMRQWSKLLRNDASRLHGFDSFEGLPDDWDPHGSAILKKGHFSTNGNVPKIPDSRVHFFKGWFEDTLPQYKFIDSPVLVIFLDADLYSSTSFVLKILKPHIKVGTIIYFDEFWDSQHEMKAFEEFLTCAEMSFKLVASTYGMRHVAFSRVG
jgi:hypothetical protein